MGFRERLFDILSTEVTYNEFIRHLSKEFSIELLLSLTEFVQFQNAQKAKIVRGSASAVTLDSTSVGRSNTVSKRETDRECALVLPTSIPQSLIVSSAEWNGQEQAFALFKKYIR